MGDELGADRVARWLEQATDEELLRVARPPTIQRLLLAARQGMRAAASSRVNELGEEVDDVLRRYVSETTPR